MNKTNADKLMQEEIIKIRQSEKKPTLLLHTCCAPCFTGCIERLTDFSVSVFFYNPNMDSVEEFYKRRDEQMRICSEFGVNYIQTEYSSQDFYSVIKGYETAKEGGERCGLCFDLRLRKTGEYAKLNGYDYFATTLTLSPLKNADRINCIGKKIEEDLGVKYLPSNFKKRGGYARSVELSEKLRLYRQNYCGCVFSKR